MKQSLAFLSLVILLASCSAIAGDPSAITGEIVTDHHKTGRVVIRCYDLHVTKAGVVWRLSKRDVYGAREPMRTLTLEVPGKYEFKDLPAGHYSVVTFMDLNGNGALDFDPPEPFGWYAERAAGWIDPIDLTKGDFEEANIVLRTPRPFPTEGKETADGRLTWIKGLPVLQLRGELKKRGYAHGYLVGEQIIDFFEFYILEDSWRSAAKYESVFVPFLESKFDYRKAFLEECDEVIRGMRDSGIDMKVHWLGRDFNRTDLLAINSYIERRAAYPSPPPASGCSQFAFWGDFTKGTDVDGGLIAGRNMDGEIDIRKVTVSHFLVFAIDPAGWGGRRWVSAMWPGFVGTISGITEDGLYSMENAGGTKEGPVVGRLTPCSWVQRFIMEEAGSKLTAENINILLDGFKSEGGGVFGPGSIILWALPYEGQDVPAFITEGDRFGTAVRLPGEVRPLAPTCIMATNYHKKYGADPDRPETYFGKRPSFSSHWRYETAMHTIEAWARQGKAVGTAEMIRLLQEVAHGTTEYSVIFRANKMEIDIAVDDLETDMWDAPYQKWVTYKFYELF